MFLFLYFFFAGLGWFALGEADPALVFLLSSPAWSRKAPSRAPLSLCERGFVIQNTQPKPLSPSSALKKALLLTASLTSAPAPSGMQPPLFAFCPLQLQAPVFRDSLQIWGLTVSGGLLTAPPL